jgi:hypothetical protein
MLRTAVPDERVPVLIVGGGGAGLTASMLLARQGVEHLLVSARPRTSDLPKAHVLNQRAMEVLEDVGVAEPIARIGTPAEQMAATAFYAGFAGPHPDYGRRVARLECWGAGGEDESWRAASAGSSRTCRRSVSSRCSKRVRTSSPRDGDPVRSRADRPRAGRRGCPRARA